MLKAATIEKKSAGILRLMLYRNKKMVQYASLYDMHCRRVQSLWRSLNPSEDGNREKGRDSPANYQSDRGVSELYK